MSLLGNLQTTPLPPGSQLDRYLAVRETVGQEERGTGICPPPSPSKVLPPPTLALIQDYRLQMLFPSALLNELEFLRKYDGMKQADRKFFPNNNKEKFSCYTEKLNI